MVSNYNLSELRKFIRDIDQIMAESWMILAESPCVLYPKALRFDEEVIRAYVSFSNDVKWTCSVIIPMKLAIYLAEKFCDNKEKLNDEVIREVAGEFINIIVGNIQGVLENPSHLSLPVANVYSDDSTIDYQGIRRNYQTPKGEFVITLNSERGVLW